MKWMGKADSPLNMRLRMSLQQWRWLLQFLRACNNQTNKMNGDHILRLSLLSRQVMQAWRDEDNLCRFPLAAQRKINYPSLANMILIKQQKGLILSISRR